MTMVTNQQSSPALPRFCPINQTGSFEGAPGAGVIDDIMETICKLFRLLIDPATENGERAAAARVMRQCMERDGITVDAILWKPILAKRKTYSDRALYPMPFGKFKGSAIQDIPTYYLIFIVEKMDRAPEWLVDAAKEIISERSEE